MVMNILHKNIKILKVLMISLLIFLISCHKNQGEKLKTILADDNGKKWLCYSIDSVHSFYPYRVKEFFTNGKQIQYINNFTTKKLETIPKDDMNNPEKWFVINDSVISIESERNPVSGYYHKRNRKVLFFSKDSIILQGTKRSNYEGILILTKYNDSTR